ncbi:conserved Plasmodium protein, unknown function [Plasmodium knowlesi strain H]|nr:conserved Plasmodium protein, unknown function [Plasmodium knowlesi strain H]SBO25371.1 conserved Plasmodium protein, unknown function [Plasmodium knowlesi strain H]
MVIGKVLRERACPNHWGYIYVEKEIHTRINDLLNRIVYGRNSGGVCLQGREEGHFTERVLTQDNSNGKGTSKRKCYDKIAVDLLKEYVRGFHREKGKCRLVVFQGEELTNGEKTVEGKEQRVNNLSQFTNGKSLNRDSNLPKVQLTEYRDTSSLKKKRPSRELVDNLNNKVNTSVHLNDLQYIWLKHTMIIFKLLIESNRRVEEKRKSEMTTTVLVLLKRTLRDIPRGCPENGSTKVDTLLQWAYLLSKVNMVDKELIIQMCHFFQNKMKTLSSVNKFYLLSCMSSFHFLSKKFLRLENYLQRYFYNLLRMELGGHLHQGGVNLPTHRHEEHSKEGSESTYTRARIANRMDEPTDTLATHPTFSTSELCQVLFKQKKHLTHLDRTILKNVLNGEVMNYGKVTAPFFKFIVKLGDRDLQRFLFDRIMEHVELYEQADLNNVLGSFIKREGLRRKSQERLEKGAIHQAEEQDEEFSTLVNILLEANLDNMNLKHVCYLYVYINRHLKKELRKNMRGRKKKDMQAGECVDQTNYTTSRHTTSEQEVHTNTFLPFEEICEEKDFYEGVPDGDPHEGNINLMNQVNEKIILTLEKKMYYIKMNNIVTLIYNTCPIISPKQVAFLEICFAHLVEEKYLMFNLAKVYRSLYNRFLHSGMFKSAECRIPPNRGKYLNQSSISSEEDAKWIFAVRLQHDEKMEKIFSYLKERYYLKREQDLGDISICTILLNVCQKFLLELLVYSFHRSQRWGVFQWKEQLPRQGHLGGSGAAAVLDLVQHIYTHLHFVFVSTRGGLKEKGVKDDWDGDGYNHGDHLDRNEEAHLPLYRKQFELALLYGRNLVSHMGSYVDSVESAFELCGTSVDGVTVGHLSSTLHGSNEMNNSDGKNMHRGITPNVDSEYSDQDFHNDPMNVQNVRDLMHYVNYVCSYIREQMEKVEVENTWGKAEGS